MMLVNMKLMTHSNINARAIEAEQAGKKCVSSGKC